MEIRYSSHSAYMTIYHVVLITKFRKKVLNPGFGKYTENAIRRAMEEIEGTEIEEINAQLDHVHMILLIPPRYSIAAVIRKVKVDSAKDVRKEFEWMDKVYWGTRSLWGKGYFVSTIGLNEEQIRNYVKYQQKQDLGQTKFEI